MTLALVLAATVLVVLAVLFGDKLADAAGAWWGRRTTRPASQPATAESPALPPVPPAARHRRTDASPSTETATGVIRRIDPRMLPDDRPEPVAQ